MYLLLVFGLLKFVNSQERHAMYSFLGKQLLDVMCSQSQLANIFLNLVIC